MGGVKLFRGDAQLPAALLTNLVTNTYSYVVYLYNLEKQFLEQQYAEERFRSKNLETKLELGKAMFTIDLKYIPLWNLLLPFASNDYKIVQWPLFVFQLCNLS